MPGSRTFWERTDGSLGFEVLQAEHIKNVVATLKMEAISSSEILVTDYMASQPRKTIINIIEVRRLKHGNPTRFP
jgi:hypothetical protein